ncbi:hypothetical protein EMCRGX_G013623 [Ephydatia muelleri]
MGSSENCSKLKGIDPIPSLKSYINRSDIPITEYIGSGLPKVRHRLVTGSLNAGYSQLTQLLLLNTTSSDTLQACISPCEAVFALSVHKSVALNSGHFLTLQKRNDKLQADVGSELGHCLAGEQKSHSTFLLQRLPVAVQRGNAALDSATYAFGAVFF